MLIYLTTFVIIIIAAFLSCYYMFYELENTSIRRFTGVFYKKTHFHLQAFSVLVSAILLITKYGYTASMWYYFVLMLFLSTAAMIDIKAKIIPNKLVITMFLLSVPSMILNKQVGWFSAIVAGVIVGIAFLTLYLLTKGSLGLGDVKIFTCVGLYIGAEKILSAMVVSTTIVGLAALCIIMGRFSDRKKSIPFAPFIFVGTLITLVYLY